MTDEKIIEFLGKAWDVDKGFFYKLRTRNINF